MPGRHSPYQSPELSPVPFPLPTHSKTSKLLPVRKLTATTCLTLTILLGNVGVSASAYFQKGVAADQSGDFVTVLREWTPLAEQGDIDAQFHLGVRYRK